MFAAKKMRLMTTGKVLCTGRVWYTVDANVVALEGIKLDMVGYGVTANNNSCAEEVERSRTEAILPCDMLRCKVCTLF